MTLCNSNLPFLVVVRFQFSDSGAYHNSIVRQRPILKSSFGAIPLLTVPRLELIEEIGNWENKTARQRYGIGIIGFPSITKVRDWIETCYEVRQREWMYPVDIIIVPSRWRIKDINRNTIVEIIECVKFKNSKRFSKEYLEKIDLSKESNVIAVPQYATEVLRGSWNPLYLIINIWNSEAEYNTFSLFARNDISDIVFGYSYIGHFH